MLHAQTHSSQACSMLRTQTSIHRLTPCCSNPCSSCAHKSAAHRLAPCCCTHKPLLSLCLQTHQLTGMISLCSDLLLSRSHNVQALQRPVSSHQRAALAALAVQGRPRSAGSSSMGDTISSPSLKLHPISRPSCVPILFTQLFSWMDWCIACVRASICLHILLGWAGVWILGRGGPCVCSC